MLSQQHLAVNRHVAKKYSVISQFKGERGCGSCPETDPIVLDLHHRETGTKHQKLKWPTKGWHRLTWDELYTELEKCDVLCANCHRRLTHAERGYHQLIEGY